MPLKNSTRYIQTAFMTQIPRVPRILIVDDDTVIAHLIGTMLQKKGYNIVGKIISGEEAIGASAALNPDLVIMDIHLSGVLDGITAARYIFQIFFSPVIFITGTDDEAVLEPARYSQPYGIIFKPFSSIELTSNVDLALYNHTVHKRSHRSYPAGPPDDMMVANEVILLLDTNGRILLFNPYAAWFLGLKDTEILMNSWNNVLTLINDITGEPQTEPVGEVVRHQVVVRYDAANTVVTRNGKRRKASMILRPIKDDHDQLLALLMKIKEKTP